MRVRFGVAPSEESDWYLMRLLRFFAAKIAVV